MTIPFGTKFVASEQFKAVFREGMALVEATASYLDGEGRKQARGLSPAASLAYATESMRLTTRLMQVASWLLIRRAVNDGELTPQQAGQEKHKVKLKPSQSLGCTVGYEELPCKLRALIDASHKLHQRIVKLDKLVSAEFDVLPPAASNPLSAQLDWIKAAFESGPESPMGISTSGREQTRK